MTEDVAAVGILLIAAGVIVLLLVGYVALRGRRHAGEETAVAEREVLEAPREEAVEEAPAEAAAAAPPVEAPEAPPGEAPPFERVEGPAGEVEVRPEELFPPEVVEGPPEVREEAPPEPAVEVPERPALLTRLRRGLAKSRAALGDRLAAVAGRGRLDDEAWDEIEEALVRADVGIKATTRIMERLRERRVGPGELREALREELVRMLGDADRTFRVREENPSVWLVVGVNGTGKTTSIAKLAHRLKGDDNSDELAAADTFRAAAIDQLGTWAERVGVHMVRHAPGADPAAVVYDATQYARARDIDVVIVDTAGRLHTKSNLMEELKKVRRVAEKGAPVTEVLLVLDATVGQNGIVQAKSFQEAVDVSGVILTKLDGTARGGIVLAVQEELGIPVKAVGIGESLDDLEPFDPEVFVEALLDGGPAGNGRVR